jgi:hypothetical protein
MSMDGSKVNVNGHDREDGYQPITGPKVACMGYHLDAHSMELFGKSTSIPVHDFPTHEIHVNGTMDSSFFESSEKISFTPFEPSPLGHNLVMDPKLTETLRVGNPSLCHVLSGDGKNFGSSIEILIGDLKCNVEHRGTYKTHYSSQRVSTLRPATSYPSYSSSCQGVHYNLQPGKVSELCFKRPRRVGS